MLIYKITSPNTDLVYVGRTTYTLRQRLICHRSAYKGFLAGKPKTYQCSSFKVLEHGDCSIVLIEETEDASRELYWMNTIPNTCNERRGLFVDKAAHNRAYHADNREVQNAKARRKEPCPKCGLVVSHGIMSRHQRSKRCQNHGL